MSTRALLSGMHVKGRRASCGRGLGMSGFEFNKLMAAFLTAALFAMVVGVISDMVYEPEHRMVCGRRSAGEEVRS